MKMENKFYFETEKGTIDIQNIGPELFTALGNFQNDCPTIPKNKKGYGYNYADFTRAVEMIKPIMNKHKIGFTQLLEGADLLRTIVFHYETGQYIQTVKLLPVGHELKGMNISKPRGRETLITNVMFCLICWVLFRRMRTPTQKEKRNRQKLKQPKNQH